MQDHIILDPVPLDELTLGEIDSLEEHSQASIDQIAKIVTEANDPVTEAMPKGRIFRALALIQLQRLNPEATFDETANVVFRVPQAASADPDAVAEIAGNAVPPIASESPG